MREFGAPTPAQERGWPAIHRGGHTLIAAPTGAGKTLAAFLSAIDELVRDGAAGDLPHETRVLYISPLKALGNDIQRNLRTPLDGIAEAQREAGLPPHEISVVVRSGDTSAADRARMIRRPPHIVVTTPESFYLLLTSEGGRRLLSTVRSVIVDEIHAMLPSKRGSHLALSLARLDALVEHRVTRVGLSATQKPLDVVSRFLTGRRAGGGRPECTVVDLGHSRQMDVALEMPPSPLEAVMSGEVWEEIYDRLAQQVLQHRTTLIFVNTRRVAERLSRHLATRIGEDQVTAHHGSLSKEKRLEAEQSLKSGELRALVATASLELGIDIGTVDLVCQMGSPNAISACLQRVGRAGHHLGATPKGRVYPLSRDDLVECTALLDSVRRGELDEISFPIAPLDILAQQIVAAVACDEWDETELYDRFRCAEPYAELEREKFDAVVRMLSEGFASRRGRRGAHLHRDAVNGKLRSRRGARISALTSGGAIPDSFDYDVVMEPTGAKVGSINEDFAIESMAGDIFQLGNTSWQILKVDPGVVRVADAKGQPPTIPFWLGEAPSRSDELSVSVSRLRERVSELLEDAGTQVAPDEIVAWLSTRLAEEYSVPSSAALQLSEYLAASSAALGGLPTQQTLILERFFDDSGGMQLVLHSPFGARINRAWGLSLRKTFCQRFNFELQAAATEDALVLSLGPTHSFELSEVFSYLHPATFREKLVQACLVAPMFETRWRWNASRALAVLRMRGGKRVAPRLQRLLADDLLALAFPDQAACQDNMTGPREVPDHPLVQQTLDDCMTEAMDIDAFEVLLGAVVAGQKRLVCKDLTEPSPLAQEIINARPYAFLDDTPLEERRTQAVYSRRFLTPEAASELGALDPQAIAQVCEEAWPPIRDADELHDALLVAGVLTQGEMAPHAGVRGAAEKLVETGRVARVSGDGVERWVAVERFPEWSAVHSEAAPAGFRIPDEFSRHAWTREEALIELARSRAEVTGPLSSSELAAVLCVGLDDAEIALAALESEGFVLKGSFRPAIDGAVPASGGSGVVEWCERGLLARIHRYTLQRLRREIEPVSAADFLRFLLRWQNVDPDEQLRGPEGLRAVGQKLEGFSAAAAAWEGDLLPSRVGDYDPAWLDSLCLSGQVLWARTAPPQSAKPSGPVRSTPISLVSRQHWHAFSAGAPDEAFAPEGAPEDARTDAHPSEAMRLHQVLATRGACFFDELVSHSGLLRTQVERALGVLVSGGRVTSDSFVGLRALLVPADRRAGFGRSSGGSRSGRRRRVTSYSLDTAGRWSLLDHRAADDDASDRTEVIARGLLARYGVVFRALLARETSLPPWRDLLRCYRRLEARGELRGGRFVSGFSGEQYALPEAVASLRAVRRAKPSGKFISVSAADPLNLVGILVPGARVPALASNRVLYRDGVAVGFKLGDAIDVSASLAQQTHGDAKAALRRHAVPRELRSYLRL